MSDPYIGQIILFGGNFAPLNWAFCNGALLAIADHDALFAILGTTYGGDGQVTFALPDLRGRAPIHVGGSPGPGRSTYQLGEVGGTETVPLSVNQLAAHAHPVKVAARNEPGVQSRPGGNILAAANNYDAPASADATLGGVSMGDTGGNFPHENRQPYLACNYIICLYGIFPSRS